MIHSIRLKPLAIGVAAGLLAAVPALADNSAAAYTDNGTAVIGSAAAFAGVAAADGYVKVLSTTLANSGSPKDLIIGLSFETTLFTMTSVNSKNGKKAESTADAAIEMMVLVDGIEAAPGSVTFDRRRQTLWATLGGNLTCSDSNADNIINYDECSLTSEEIGLILDTKAAHAFNFVANNIGSGEHTVEAYARLSRSGEVVGDGVDSDGEWEANASLGKGTLSVLEVHDSVTH